MPQRKRCTCCGKQRVLSKFGRRYRDKETLKARCKSCDREYQKKWLSDPKNYKKAQSSWLKHARSLEHKRRRRDLQLRRLYGITLEEWEHRYKGQHGRCFLCKKNKRLLTDHDHQTGKFRGLICYSCNSAIGLLHDSPVIVKRLLGYLRGK